MRLLLTFARTYPLQSAVVLICLLLGGIAEAIGLSTLLPILSIATAGQRPQETESEFARVVTRALEGMGLNPNFETLLVVLLVAVYAQGALWLLANRQVGYTVAHVATDHRLSLLRSLSRARWSYYTQLPVGVAANAMASEAERGARAYLYGATFVSLCMEALMYSALALAVSWRFTLGASAAGWVIVYAVRALIRRTRKAGLKQTRVLRSLLGRLTDSLQAIKPLKAMGLESRIGPVLEDDTERLNRALRRQVFAKEALRAVQPPLLVTFAIPGLYLAVTFWSFPLAELLVLLFFFDRTLARLSKAQRQYQHMVTEESAYWALRELIESADRAREENPGARQPTLRDAVALRDIDLRYGDHIVLRNASLEVPAGQITALLGPSGAGKTTIADLASGLLQPEGGEVLIDGVPLAEIDLARWRAMIGYVPQEMFLLNDSVRANVTLGDDAFDDAAVESALRRAGAWDFVAALPQGVDTPVGERGSLLSGGQRQRISIARALVRNPQLLILDEATTGLDAETEAAVWRAIGKLRGETTVLAISHQPAARTVADRVYRIDAHSLHREDEREGDAPTPAGVSQSPRR